MEREYLKPIPPMKTDSREDSVLDKLSVTVDYEKGGWSCFTGDLNDRGIYVYVKPTQLINHVYNGKTFVTRKTVISGNRKLSGFKVFIKPLTRKSEKQLDIIYNKVGQVIDEVVAAYVNEDFTKVAELLMKC